MRYATLTDLYLSDEHMAQVTARIMARIMARPRKPHVPERRAPPLSPEDATRWAHLCRLVAMGLVPAPRAPRPMPPPRPPRLDVRPYAVPFTVLACDVAPWGAAQG